MALTLLRKLGERFNKAVTPGSSSPAGLSSGSVLSVAYRDVGKGRELGAVALFFLGVTSHAFVKSLHGCNLLEQ